MNRQRTQLLLVVGGALLANMMFWNEKFGLNCLIFTLFWLGALWWLYPERRNHFGLRATAVGALLSALMIVLHNGGAAKFAWIISVCSVAGFAQVRDLEWLLAAFLKYWTNFFMVPSKMAELWRNRAVEAQGRIKAKSSVMSWVFKALIPILVATCFYFLYYVANPKFAALADAFWSRVGQIFTLDLPFMRIFFCFVLMLFTGAGLLKCTDWLDGYVGAVPQFLQRTRPTPLPQGQKHFTPRIETVGLRREYQQSLITLGLLNAMLLLVNLTDITSFWFDFDAKETGDLKDFVHFGTYTLILSVLMAMLVMLYIYRKNLNFYPNSKTLLLLAQVWLIQNALLVISVCIRNWHYIEYHALAYKRIGVYLFLTLVLIGLATLWRKIAQKRTTAWLLHTNSWAVFALILVNACVPWDQWITRYNLATEAKGAIDIEWLLTTVSDKNLRTLEDNKEVLHIKESYPKIDAEGVHRLLENKRARFDTEQAGYSFWSFNLADAGNK